MKFAIISDTHFGDPMSTLVEPTPNGEWKIGTNYSQFKANAGKDNDFLILLGDILDFSIAGYQEAYKAAKVFFEQIQKDRIANEIIYVPGNHDADLWHIVEHQVNIIKQIEKNNPPRPFRMSVPGILNCKSGINSKPFILAGVTENTNGPQYGGLFLDSITSIPTRFNFAYPNLYLLTDSGNYLLTHGHYLEEYWSFAGEYLMKIAQEDLHLGDTYDLRELVGVNFPTNQLACSGVGMAGPLSGIVKKLQREIKDNNFIRVKKYMKRLQKIIDKKLSYPWYEFYKELLSDKVIGEIKKYILDDLEKMQSARFSNEFAHKPEVLTRFRRFYSASLVEIDRISSAYHIDVTPPTRVIFGHTHQPIPVEISRPPIAQPFSATQSRPIYLYNTGGWLKKSAPNATELFPGALVFTYSDNKGLESKPVS